MRFPFKKRAVQQQGQYQEHYQDTIDQSTPVKNSFSQTDYITEYAKMSNSNSSKDYSAEYAKLARANPSNLPSKEDLMREALVRQYVLIIDKSGSMNATEYLDDNHVSRWQRAQNIVENLIDTIFQYDMDKSVPLYFFDRIPFFAGEMRDKTQVSNTFRQYSPDGSTNLAGGVERNSFKVLWN